MAVVDLVVHRFGGDDYRFKVRVRKISVSPLQIMFLG